MASLNFDRHSLAPLKTIKEVQFGLFSPEEVAGMSVAHIQYPETIDEQNHRPRENGLGDPRLGTVDRNYFCATCNENAQVCPGHFGHIELAVPVFHVGFIRKIQKLLEMVCHSCGKVLADASNQQFADALRIRDRKRRFEALHKICKLKKVCEMTQVDDDFDATKDPKKVINSHGGCGALQPTIRKDGLKLVAEIKQPKGDDDDDVRQSEKRPITPREALNIFKLISDEDIAKLGFNTEFSRPEWMIIINLPVPPQAVRPSISVDGTGQGMRGEDDLTHKLGDIIRANGNVKRCYMEGSPQHVVNEFEALLQYHVATFFDNNIAGQPQSLQKTGRPLKTLRSRLKGKEGRLRGNLMGKRVDFSARTVITGDPNLSLDEVGVPRSTAKILTYPETVTPYNIAKLTQLVRNGPNEHPGAKYIIRDDGVRIDLRHGARTREISLQYGWKVERHIVDGDFVIFNRQPSLHKESMMGHRVRVMPYSTFRLNLSVTTPYNADFDGDEMNLHVPQSEETRAEISQLCMVGLNIVSPQKNGPLMGIIQDTLCGIYKLTRRDVFLTREEVMNVMMQVPDWDGVIPMPAILKPIPRWTGKQMISMALPSGLNLIRDPKNLNPPADQGVFVLNGELMYGQFVKKYVGAEIGGVVHTVYNEKGPEGAIAFFNGAQKIVNYWLLHNGFSVGIGDTVPDAKTTVSIQGAVDRAKADFEKISKEAYEGKLEALPGMTVRETFESKVSKALGDARQDAGKATEDSLKDLNNAVQMSRSGSKGSMINISQMTALVGQQAVEGKRIPYGFTGRTLPHFPQFDYSPEARGFIQNSYLRGLTPVEFFFHAMAGREGLIDTAVKTAETGYIQRRLVKALEDVMVKYDGSVRNSVGDIVEFIYGEDGLDACCIENQHVDIVPCSDRQFEEKVRVDVMDSRMSLSPDVLEQAAEIAGDLEVQGHFDEEWAQLQKDRALLRTVDPGFDEGGDMQLPLNVMRMIETAKTKFHIKDSSRSDLHPSEAIPQVREALDRLVVVRGEDKLSKEAQDHATMIFKAYLRTRLAFKRLVKEHHLNKLALDNILGELENRFLRAAASPGEMVGVLAAQSIGEPATQMTLNTFHYTGIASKNVTLGVPRLKEILNVATNIKTPAMTVYQSPENRLSQDTAKQLRSLIEHTTLRSVTDRTEIYYDPDVQTTVIEADQDMVESYFIIPDDAADDPNMQSKFVLRIVLSRRKLLDKNLTVTDVAAKIKEQFSTDLAVISSDNNADEQVIRVRLMLNNLRETASDEDKETDVEEDTMLKRIEGHLLDNLTIRGLQGVERAFIDHLTVPRIDESGAVVKLKNDPLCTEWFLSTTGTSLKDALEVDGVDSTRTVSNSFSEIFSVLGIEATRSALFNELWKVLTFDGSYFNKRHVALLADVMCHRGFLMAITRHGINRADTGALMRCSFEETVEILLEAAGAGDLDDCRGVSENIMLGQLAPLGTGEIEVYLDQKMLNTAASDNARFGLMPGMVAATSMVADGAATPYDITSPSHEGGFGGGDYGASFSPMAQAGTADPSGFTPYGGGFGDGGFSPYAGATSPGYQPTSPFSGTSPTSPGYSPASPGYSPASPGMALTSPRFNGASPSSPAYNPTSPMYSPTSPALGGSPTSPSYSPTSPSYSPTSPGYSPTSPAFGGSPTSPSYSPTSPSYSPTSPAFKGSTSPHYSPTSPAYSPTSPVYSPTSPTYGGAARASPTSPKYSPTSPSFSPTSPVYSPTSPAANHSSYSPTSPRFSPGSPMSGTSQQYSPTSPTFSPQ